MHSFFWSEDWRRVFALAIGLGVAEWLRGHLFSGFPWNSIGYALTAGEVLMQSAALFGLYALNVIAVAIFAAPAALAPAIGGKRRNFVLPSIAIVAVAALGLYGVLRLSQATTAFVPDVTVRIMQPALEQLQKWDPDNKDEVLSTYFRLSAPEGAPLSEGHAARLAGIRVSVSAHAGCRRARGDRRAAAGRDGARDRRLS